MAQTSEERGALQTRSLRTVTSNPRESIPDSLDALLTRGQAGAALRASGFPVADKTLATMATRGGGPAYRRFGTRVLYRWRDAIEWAEARLSSAITATSQLDGK